MADHLLRGAIENRYEIWVPVLWYYEIANLLASAHRRNRLSEEQVEEAVGILSDIPIAHLDNPDTLSYPKACSGP